MIRVLFQDVELREPAFKEVLVAYRLAPSRGSAGLGERLRRTIAGLKPLSWLGQTEAAAVQPQERLPLQIRIYRDIAVRPHPCLQIRTLQIRTLQIRTLQVCRSQQTGHRSSL